MCAVRPTLIVFQEGLTLSPASMAPPPIPTAVSSPSLSISSAPVPDAARQLERLVLEAQQSATLDLLEVAATTGAFEQAILVTEDRSFAQRAQAMAEQWADRLSLQIESYEGESFHFGQALQAVCRAHSLRRVVYAGGGAMPLAAGRELADLALAVSGEGHCVVANNLYSADVVALHPASALEHIELPAADNDLAWLLYYRAGLPFAPMPRTLATQFDIDTPTDLAVLWWCAQLPPVDRSVGPHLSQLLARVPAAMPSLLATVARAYKVMATRRADLLVAGRVSSWVWRRLEVNLPCQTRIISEERGMRASGREARGEVRSLLGLYLDMAGVDGFLHALERVCDAAFVDSRVLFAHRRLNPSRPDRFASDALAPDLIQDPWVREFTQAAASASVPVVLGGHSLISGGLWALSERVRSSGPDPSSSASAGETLHSPSP